MAKQAGYRKPSGAELRAMAAARQAAETGPAALAQAREASFLRSAQTAQGDLDWLISNEAWGPLGFDTFADWWDARVSPVLAELPFRPTREIAQKVVKKVKADEASLPRSQRRTGKQLAAMVGLSAQTARRLAPRSAPATDGSGSDLENGGPEVIDGEVVAEREPDPADVADALKQAITEVATGSSSPDPVDEHHCENCGCDLTMQQRHAGDRRCYACDPSRLHRLVNLPDGTPTTVCDECARQERLVQQAAVDGTQPSADAGDPHTTSVPAAGHLGERTSEVPGNPQGSEPGANGLGDPAGDGEETSPAGEIHEEISGWTGGPGDCGVECSCGVLLGGFATLAEARAELAEHIADPDKPEELDDEGMPVVETRDSPAAGPSEDAPEVVLTQQPGAFSPTDRDHAGQTSPPEVPAAIATTGLSEMAATPPAAPEGDSVDPRPLSPSGPDHPGGVPGEAREVAASELLGDDGRSLDELSSPSDPEVLLGEFRAFTRRLHAVDVDALGPLLLDVEVEALDEMARQIATFVDLLDLARQRTP